MTETVRFQPVLIFSPHKNGIFFLEKRVPSFLKTDQNSINYIHYFERKQQLESYVLKAYDFFIDKNRQSVWLYMDIQESHMLSHEYIKLLRRMIWVSRNNCKTLIINYYMPAKDVNYYLKNFIEVRVLEIISPYNKSKNPEDCKYIFNLIKYPDDPGRQDGLVPPHRYVKLCPLISPDWELIHKAVN